MTWEGYCRHFGIVSGKKLRQIKSMEVNSYEELSTWEQ